MQLHLLFTSLAGLVTVSFAGPIAGSADSLSEAGLAERNILVPADVIPTSTVLLTSAAVSQATSPVRLPTSTVDLATDAVAKRDLTSIPNLVPSTTVNLATDSTGTAFTGTPQFMPTTVVRLGSPTPGCSVWMSEITYGSQPVLTGYSYVTGCQDGAAATTQAV